MNHEYFVYIITNKSKKSLYIGVTNNLTLRLAQHFDNRGDNTTWPGRYRCYLLIYYESFLYVDKAIAREKQIKNWSRQKKEWLISRINPQWEFLNRRFSIDKNE